jgi:hypothetical protein
VIRYTDVDFAWPTDLGSSEEEKRKNELTNSNDRSALWSYEYEIGVNSLTTHIVISFDEIPQMVQSFSRTRLFSTPTLAKSNGDRLLLLQRVTLVRFVMVK